MEKVLCLYKPVGPSPLQVIHAFRQKNPEYRNVPLGYAGRLDPMAKGILLVLVGDENKKRKIYEDLPKEYSFRAVFGIATDTYDVMGRIIHTNQTLPINVKEKIQEVLPSFFGIYMQEYPPYSSRTVQGKPLYYWARENKLTEIVIPKKQVEIFSLKLESVSEITCTQLVEKAKKAIVSASGDFRQKEILNDWDLFLEKNNNNSFPIAQLSLHCSSGTYVRQIIYELALHLRTHAIALEITRTKVKDFSLEDAISFV